MRVGASRTNSEGIEKIRKSTKKQIFFMIICFFIFVFLLLEVIKLFSYTFGKYDKEKMWLYNSVNSIVQKVYTKKNVLQKVLKMLKDITLQMVWKIYKKN